jgi:hypothetical protein
MACNTTLADITYSCDDLALGGLTKVWLVDKTALDSASPEISVSGNSVTISPDAATLDADGLAYALEFNIKDGFSSFTDVKTISDGSVTAVPTITVEIPKMSAAHRDALEDLANPNAEILALIQTAAGTQHLVGWEYGLFVSTIDGASGTSRSEKNRYQVTLTGEQASLALDIDNANWLKVG